MLFALRLTASVLHHLLHHRGAITVGPFATLGHHFGEIVRRAATHPGKFLFSALGLLCIFFCCHGVAPSSFGKMLFFLRLYSSSSISPLA
jgi:hypothetical protein